MTSWRPACRSRSGRPGPRIKERRTRLGLPYVNAFSLRRDCRLWTCCPNAGRPVNCTGAPNHVSSHVARPTATAAPFFCAPLGLPSQSRDSCSRKGRVHKAATGGRAASLLALTPCPSPADHFVVPGARGVLVGRPLRWTAGAAWAMLRKCETPCLCHKPKCHPERSEGSPLARPSLSTSPACRPRFFAALRMTGTCWDRFLPSDRRPRGLSGCVSGCERL